MNRSGTPRPRILCLLGALACAIGGAQAREACPAPQFKVSDLKIGIGERDRGWFGAISLVDTRGSGHLDIYATNGYDVLADPRTYKPARSMLYLNDGKARFRRDEASALSNAANFASGSTWGDVFRTGRLDAFVPVELGRRDAFFRNLGGGRFEGQELGDATRTTGGNFTASWADIDGDGDLDLYVGGPTLELPEPSLIYRNDNGSFVRVTDIAIENGKSNPGAALWADFDNDGRPDLFVANSDIVRASGEKPYGQYESSVLYRNDGDWKFTHTGGQDFENPAFPAVGAAVGDYDNDGDLDLLVGMSQGNNLQDRIFRNDGTGHFRELSDFRGPAHKEQSYAGAFADFNGDGNLDLMIPIFNLGIFLYLGDGLGHFTPYHDPALEMRIRSYSGMAVGDLDGDGRLDVVIGSWGETHGGEFITLLHNETPRCGSWAELVLKDQYGAPNPPGARVVLNSRDADGNERRQLREASAQTGWRSQGASHFLFALPKSEGIIGAEIRWPNGKVQRLYDLKQNYRTIVSYPG
jgi:hypothetical protein